MKKATLFACALAGTLAATCLGAGAPGIAVPTVAYAATDDLGTVVKTGTAGTATVQYTDKSVLIVKAGTFSWNELETTVNSMLGSGGNQNIKRAHFEAGSKATGASGPLAYPFKESKSLEAVTGTLDTTGTTALNEMFRGCTNLTDISGLASWDVSNVVGFDEMFTSCHSLSDLTPLSGWDTSSGTGFSCMFESCTSLTDLTPLSGFKIIGNAGLQYMFSYCSSLETLDGLDGWTFLPAKPGVSSNVMGEGTRDYLALDCMFVADSNLTDISALAAWALPEKTVTEGMFCDCTSLTDLTPVGSWNFSGSRMTESLFSNVPVTKITFSAGTDLGTDSSLWSPSGGTYTGYWVSSDAKLTGYVTTEQLLAASAADRAGTWTAVQKVEMFRLYNPWSGEHFYTASATERDTIVKAGWKYEGVGWTAPSASATPVYRLYSGTDHHYTMSTVERDYLKSVGWKDEGTGWYSDDAKGVVLLRQYNPYVDPNAATNNSGSHNYTTSQTENDALVAAGWKAEGPAWYGMKTS
jgi:surface protein